MADTGGGIWDSIGAELSVGYDTDYVFRGYDLGHDHVWTALDLSIPLGDQLEASIGAWYTTGFNDGENELDVYASLSFDFGAWGLDVGYTHYSYPNGLLGDGSTNGGETNEAYISAGTTLGPIDVALAYYYDFDLEISYVEGTAGTSIPLNNFASLDPSVGLSWVDVDGGDSGLNHFFARLDLPIALTGSATLTPYVATSVALDVADDAGQNDMFWGGVALSVSF